MADYNSSLPVRTQNPGDVIVKIADATTPSQQQAVNAAGSAQIAGQGIAGTPAGGVVSVQGVVGGQAVPVSGTLSITDPAEGPVGSPPPADALYIGALVSTSSPSFMTGNMESLSLTLAGAVRVDGSAVTQPISAVSLPLPAGAATSANQTTMISDLSTINTSLGTINTTLGSPFQAGGSIGNASFGASQVGTWTVQQGSAPWSQNITEVLGAAPSATNALATQIATAGAYVSASNPLPVKIESPTAAGTPENYYTDSSSIAVGSTATQSTTAAGATGLYLQQIVVSGSGKFKAVVSIGGTPYFAVFNSTAQPSVVIPVPNQTLVPTGTVIAVAMTNLDLAAQDLYSTISGYQI
jgi:hypothetical protein